MSQYDPKKIEELQLVLLKNPRSPVFASLAEAYRQMGLLEEALEVTTRGVLHNPEYVSGLVAHSKILYELKDYRTACKHLVKATAIKPENILALKLLGSSYLKLRQHQEALKTFKKLLIVKPDDEIALKMVQKWEFLDNLPTESGMEQFQIEDLNHWVHRLPGENHVIHLIDSFMNYGDQENALEIVSAALLKWSDSEALKKRQQLLLENAQQAPENGVADEENPALTFLRLKREFYQKCLQRIEQSKNIDR